MIYENIKGIIKPIEQITEKNDGLNRIVYKKYEKIDGINKKVFEGLSLPKSIIFYKNYRNPSLTYYKDYGMSGNFNFVSLSNRIKIVTVRNNYDWCTAILVDDFDLSKMNYVYVDFIVETSIRNYTLYINTYDITTTSMGWAHTNSHIIKQYTGIQSSILHVKEKFILGDEHKRQKAFCIGIKYSRDLSTSMTFKYLYFI